MPEQTALTQANQVYDFKLSNLTPGKTYNVRIRAAFVSRTGIVTEYTWPKNMVRVQYLCSSFFIHTPPSLFVNLLKTVSLSTPPATPTAPYLEDDAILAWSEVGGAQHYQLEGQKVSQNNTYSVSLLEG